VNEISEWEGGADMHKNYRKYGRQERLIQYVIEIFDLVEISSDTNTGKPAVRRSPRLKKRGK